MAEQGRTESGKFAQKSEELRRVRSIRLTDSTWEALGLMAAQRSITRADLIEELVEEDIIGASEPISSSKKTVEEIESLVEQVLADSLVTRNGRDKGSVRRGLKALLKLLS